MTVFGIDIAQIADLATQVAQTGALRAAEFAGDDIFEYMVGIAIVVYEQSPG